MNEGDDQCEYVYQPDAWQPVVEDAVSRLPQESWRCPHAVVNGQSRCCFHLSPDQRETVGIADQTIIERFFEALDSNRERTNGFIGGKFPEIILEEERIDATGNSPIDLRCCEFLGNVNLNGTMIDNDIIVAGSKFDERCEFQNASFTGQADFHGCDFNGVVQSEYATFGGQALFSRSDFTYSAYFRDGVEFTDNAVFTKVRFGSNASFRSARFGDQAYFRGTEFTKGATFDGAVFSAPADFGDSEFKDTTEFKGTDFEKTVYFGANGSHSDYGAASFEVEPRFEDVHAAADIDFEWTVFQEGITFDSAAINETVDFTRSSIHDHLTLSGSSTIDKMVYRPVNSGSGPTLLHVEDSTIRNGMLAQPLGGEAFFAFERSTIGDVDIMETEGGPYDLEHIRSDLGRTQFIETAFDGFDFTSYRPMLEADWNIHEFSKESPFGSQILDGRALELTYMRAKSSADDIGDNRSAAGFFIREMRGRKRRHRERLTEADSLKRKVVAGFDYVVNDAFDRSCRYSESPSRLLGSFAIPIVVFAGLYALIRALAGIPAPYQSAPPVLNYLIFSGESFITLINNPGVTVALWPIRLLSVLEGFIGALLIALFLFSLTRAIHR